MTVPQLGFRPRRFAARRALHARLFAGAFHLVRRSNLVYYAITNITPIQLVRALASCRAPRPPAHRFHLMRRPNQICYATTCFGTNNFSDFALAGCRAARPPAHRVYHATIRFLPNQVYDAITRFSVAFSSRKTSYGMVDLIRPPVTA